MNFLRSLSESQLFTSHAAYKRFSARQIAELVYLHLIAIRILSSESSSRAFATAYASHSVRYNGFEKWFQSCTDLHLLIYALLSEDVDLKLRDSSHEFRETLYFNERDIRYWLKGIAQGHIDEARTHRLFLTLDGQFQVKHPSMKAIRRLAQDWPHCSEKQRKLATTRLLQMLRVRARQSDILSPLEHLASHRRLEIHGVANQETGDEAEVSKKGSLLKGIAASAAAAFIGYHAVKSLSESEVVHRDRNLVVVRNPSMRELLLMKQDSGSEGVRAIIRENDLYAWDGAYLSFADAESMVGEGIQTTLWDGYLELDRPDAIEEIWANPSILEFYEGAPLIQIGDSDELLMEDDGGGGGDAGATTSASIAPLVSALGVVRRRVPKKSKKKK